MPLIHCKHCGCSARTSRMRGRDIPALLLGFLPFRCRVCFRRFLAWRFGAAGPLGI